MKPTLLLLLALLILPISLPAASPDEPPARHLIAVGGGNVSDEIRLRLLSLSPAEKPRVLIIPQAARPQNLESSGVRNAEHFQRLGVEQVEILDLADRDRALRAIQECDVIWMPGGLQRLLMEALDEAGLADAVRARFAAGVPVGGTSAGAAIMSKTMIAGGRRDEETGAFIPSISHGLGFWPNIIVDQHFSERSRLPRLKEAVRRHPSLIGVGIDEDTAVVYQGTRLEVMGPSSVTIVRLIETENGESRFEETILRSGDTYQLPSSPQLSCCGAGAGQ